MENANDMFAGVAATPSEFLRGLASRAVELKGQIADAEAFVSELKRELLDITQRRMVDAMAESGLSEMKLPDGWKFKVAAFVMGSLPKDEEARQKAIDWLAEHGAVNLIKTELSVHFDKSQHNMAIDAQEMLLEKGLPATLVSGVHAMSLQAWVKEALANGDEVAMDILGLDAGRVVKITAPKEAL